MTPRLVGPPRPLLGGRGSPCFHVWLLRSARFERAELVCCLAIGRGRGNGAPPFCCPTAAGPPARLRAVCPPAKRRHVAKQNLLRHGELYFRRGGQAPVAEKRFLRTGDVAPWKGRGKDKAPLKRSPLSPALSRGGAPDVRAKVAASLTSLPLFKFSPRPLDSPDSHKNL